MGRQAGINTGLVTNKVLNAKAEPGPLDREKGPIRLIHEILSEPSRLSVSRQTGKRTKL